MPPKPTKTMRVRQIITPFQHINWSSDARTRVVIKGAPFSITAADHKEDRHTAVRFTGDQPLRIIIIVQLDGKREQQTWYYYGKYDNTSKTFRYTMFLGDRKLGHPECFLTFFAANPIDVVLDLKNDNAKIEGVQNDDAGEGSSKGG